MKIAVCTLYTPDIAYYSEIGNRFKKRYCDFHGYDFHVTDKIIEPTRHPSWSKIPFVLSFLDQYDWVMWIDADAFIVKPLVKIEQFIADAGDKPYLIGTIGPEINHGVFAVKNDPWCREFYADVWSEKRNHKGGGDAMGNRFPPPWDEWAVRAREVNWGMNWHKVEHKWFNTKTPGNEVFLLHLWGMYHGQRNDIVRGHEHLWEKAYQEEGL